MEINLIKDDCKSDLLLQDACPDLYHSLSDYLDKESRLALVEQLKILIIDRQALFGNPDSFRFTVKAVPHFSLEQYRYLELRDWEQISMLFGGGYVEIQLDQFGRIELFYLSRLRCVFDVLLKFRGYIAEPFAGSFPFAD